MNEKIKVQELVIDGTTYVPKDSVLKVAPDVDGLRMCMIRTYSAGVHFGYLKKLDGKYAEVLKSQRIWYWSGACSLSQLATEGTTKPSDCKIAVEVPELILTEVIEVIPMTQIAINNLKSIKIWKS